MKRTLLNTLKALLALIIFPFALMATAMFMLVTLGNMAVGKARSFSAR